MWCALSRVGIIGTYFFEENEPAVMVNVARYTQMIEGFFLPNLVEMDIRICLKELNGTSEIG